VSFETVNDFLYMGGHYAFVWSAYGIGVVGIAFILMRPLLERRRFFAEQAQRLRRESRLANGDHDAPRTA
jgi:heme exporter protein D